MVCVDESEESLEAARAKAVAMNVEPEFRHAQPDALWLRDDHFELVLGVALWSLLSVCLRCCLRWRAWPRRAEPWSSL